MISSRTIFPYGEPNLFFSSDWIKFRITALFTLCLFPARLNIASIQIHSADLAGLKTSSTSHGLYGATAVQTDGASPLASLSQLSFTETHGQTWIELHVLWWGEGFRSLSMWRIGLSVPPFSSLTLLKPTASFSNWHSTRSWEICWKRHWTPSLTLDNTWGRPGVT